MPYYRCIIYNDYENHFYKESGCDYMFLVGRGSKHLNIDYSKKGIYVKRL